MVRLLRVLVACTGAAAPTTVLAAQPAAAPGEQVVRWTLRAPSRSAPAGDTVDVRLRATVAELWHLYAPTQPAGGPVALSVRVAGGPGFAAAGPLIAPAPDTIPDRNFNILSQVHDDSAVFVLPVRVRADANGAQPLVLAVTYQACTARYCLPPTTEELRATLAVAGGIATTARETDGVGATASMAVVDETPHPDASLADSSRAEPPAAGSTARATEVAAPVVSAAPTAVMARAPPTPGFRMLGDGAGGGTAALLPFLWLAASMGALALLTPCVLPMVPITVSWFVRDADRPVPRGRAVRRALLYGFGMVLAFSALGVPLALLVGPAGIGQLAANPWLNLAVAALFLGFALVLLGAVRVGAPGALVNRLDAIVRCTGGERWGVLLMGVTFAVTAFTCTAPFVGTMLVAAASGDWVWPLAGTAVFAATFASPFVLLALAPRLLARVPRGGAWFGPFNGALACIEIAAAVKFVSNADLVWHWGVLTRPVVLALWIACAIAAALLLLGVLPLRAAAVRPGPLRLTAAGGALITALWIAAGFGGRRLGEIEAFLPPDQTTAASVALASLGGGSGAELSWIHNDYAAALAVARRIVLHSRPAFAGRPLDEWAHQQAVTLSLGWASRRGTATSTASRAAARRVPEPALVPLARRRSAHRRALAARLQHRSVAERPHRRHPRRARSIAT